MVQVCPSLFSDILSKTRRAQANQMLQHGIAANSDK